MDTANPIYQALGSTFRRAKIAAGSIAYSANNTVSLELPNSLLQKGITLRLTGNLVIATANATIFSEAPLGLLKSVQVVGDGRRFLMNSPGRDLFRLAHVTWGKQAEIVAPSGTVGTRAFSATVRIDHEHLRAMDPVETLFDPRLYKKVELKVAFGDPTSIATAGGGGTIAFTNVSVDVLVDQTAEGVDKILFDRTVTPDEAGVTASSALFTFKVPQNGLLAGVLIRTDRDAGAGAGPVPVNDLINNISLKSDTTIAHFDRVAFNTLRAENVLEFDLDGGSTIGAPLDGYAYLPLMEHGMFSSGLNTNALNNLQLVLDVTRGSGTENIHLTYLFMEPRRSLAQAVAAN